MNQVYFEDRQLPRHAIDSYEMYGMISYAWYFTLYNPASNVVSFHAAS